MVVVVEVEFERREEGATERCLREIVCVDKRDLCSEESVDVMR